MVVDTAKAFVPLDAQSPTFHLELRAWRKQIGISQEAFAEQLCYAKKRQQSYESPPEKKHATRPRDGVLAQINAFISERVS